MNPEKEKKSKQDFVEYYLQIKLGNDKIVSGDKLVRDHNE